MSFADPLPCRKVGRRRMTAEVPGGSLKQEDSKMESSATKMNSFEHFLKLKLKFNTP